MKPEDERQAANRGARTGLALAVLLALGGCAKDGPPPTRVYEHPPEAPRLLQPQPLLPGHNYSP